MAGTDPGISALDFVPLLGAVAALLAITGAGRDIYRRTLARRRDRYARLARLGAGAQLSFFEAVLGEPPAIRRTLTKDDTIELAYAGDAGYQSELDEFDEKVHEIRVSRSYTECFFIDRDYYVQTISDGDETVLGFSVTSRSRRFRPTFEFPVRPTLMARRRWQKATGEPYRPSIKVTLGKTRFSNFGDAERDDFAGPRLQVQVGARLYWYSEVHSLGNPGYYQTFVFTASHAGADTPIGDILLVRDEIGGEAWPSGDGRDWDELTATREFRRRTVINTYSIIGPTVFFAVQNWPSTFGPNGDEVRTLQ